MQDGTEAIKENEKARAIGDKMKNRSLLSSFVFANVIENEDRRLAT